MGDSEPRKGEKENAGCGAVSSAELRQQQSDHGYPAASTVPHADPTIDSATAMVAGEAFFRTEVSLVVLHATVLDRNRRLVTGLPQEAFQVFQDGKEQRVTQFSNRDVRNQYVLAYPVPSGAKPGFRSIRVDARVAKKGKLVVRTRPGYFHEPESRLP